MGYSFVLPQNNNFCAVTKARCHWPLGSPAMPQRRRQGEERSPEGLQFVQHIHMCSNSLGEGLHMCKGAYNVKPT